MNEFIGFIQDHWFEGGTLLVQVSILALIVRYARRALMTMRASQEQVGALLRLSLSDSIAERSGAPIAEAPVLTEESVSVGAQLLGESHSVSEWLQAPMTSRPSAPWRRIIRWLQAPAGS